MKMQETIIALYHHHRALQVFKEGNRKNEHNGEPFHNIMVILANNETESKINFMMTRAICCLAWSNTKLKILSPSTTCLQPFEKSSIQFIQGVGHKMTSQKFTCLSDYL